MVEHLRKEPRNARPAGDGASGPSLPVEASVRARDHRGRVSRRRFLVEDNSTLAHPTVSRIVNLWRDSDALHWALLDLMSEAADPEVRSKRPPIGLPFRRQSSWHRGIYPAGLSQGDTKARVG
jgi:hypothetical protein